MNACKTCLRRKVRLCLVFLGFCLQSVFPVSNHDHFAREIDSLKHALSVHTEPKVVIPILSRLSKLYDQEPEQIHYLKLQYELSIKIDSIPAAYFALENLAIYYHNMFDMRDSMLYWSKRVDSIALSRNDYPNALFFVRSLSCKDLLFLKDYEMAMNDALDLYRLASEVQHTYGLIRCSECLGLIYRDILRDSDAVVAYQEGLDLLENYDGKKDKEKQISVSEKIEMQLRMSGLQLESCSRTGQYEQAENIAAKYKRLIERQERLNETERDVYPIKREYWLYYSLCADLYIRADMLDKAEASLDKATEFVGNKYSEGDYVETVYLFNLASYNKKRGNLMLALNYIDEILKNNRAPEKLRLKADIFKEQGKLNEALLLYDEIYAYELNKNNDTYLRQINQLRTLHDLNEQEAQKSELLISSQRMQQKQHQLLILMAIVAVLFISLYVLYLYFQRTRRLKDELQEEKDSLLQSESKLMREKIKAEEASRMKSTFIANMSHEVRTPLNAIVGFSELLISEEAEPEEKEEYAGIIKNNTELLLNLVNDVLDLSRMETGDLNFELKNYRLLECCQKSLDSVRHRVHQGVKLTFTPALEPIVVHTDILRLQQVLINLLGNSAKFTMKGEINLSYKLAEDKQHVCIAVTDTGYGIPLEKQADIFKRYEKLDDYKPGAGLGLSICRIITEHLGGSISVDPTYTTGARFFVIHPCETSDAACNQDTTGTT